MSSDKKVFGRPFQKGKSGNPSGNAKLTPTQAEAKKAVLDAIARIALMPRDEIRKLMQGNPIGAEIIACNLILSGKNVAEALDRTIGPVPKNASDVQQQQVTIIFERATPTQSPSDATASHPG